MSPNGLFLRCLANWERGRAVKSLLTFASAYPIANPAFIVCGGRSTRSTLFQFLGCEQAQTSKNALWL